MVPIALLVGASLVVWVLAIVGINVRVRKEKEEKEQKK